MFDSPEQFRRHRRLRERTHQRTNPTPAGIELVNAETIRQYLDPLARTIALTHAIGDVAESAGEAEIERVCGKWIGLMLGFIAEAGLTAEYERVAREIDGREHDGIL